MRILILGGDGMMGHHLFNHLKFRHEVRVTLHQELADYEKFKLFNPENAYDSLDVRSLGHLSQVFEDFHPQVVVNSAGIIKQRSEAKESLPSLEINALFPHRLAHLCKDIRARMLHMSTDCVFSGKKGNYMESDPPDADDLYGRTKFLGEVNDSHCLTLRTSIIGRELSRKKNLLEWFLAEKETVKGFKNAVFSGFTTIEFSRIIEKMLVEHPEAAGTYHVSSDPVSKFDLLTLINQKMRLGKEIISDESFKCDRSLDSTRFRREFNYTPPTWEEMVEELRKDVLDKNIQ